jgi:hypothetical protein
MRYKSPIYEPFQDDKIGGDIISNNMSNIDQIVDVTKAHCRLIPAPPAARFADQAFRSAYASKIRDLP